MGGQNSLVKIPCPDIAPPENPLRQQHPASTWTKSPVIVSLKAAAFVHCRAVLTAASNAYIRTANCGLCYGPFDDDASQLGGPQSTAAVGPQLIIIETTENRKAERCIRDSPDRLDHIEPHLNAAVGMVWPRVGQSTHAVIAVTCGQKQPRSL